MSMEWESEGAVIVDFKLADHLLARLQTIQTMLENDLKGAIEQSVGLGLAHRAQDNLYPGHGKLTGLLKGSIRALPFAGDMIVETTATRADQRVFMGRNPLPGDTRGTEGYAFYLENGSGGRRAVPFMRDALEQMRFEAAILGARALREVLEGRYVLREDLESFHDAAAEINFFVGRRRRAKASMEMSKAELARTIKEKGADF